MNAQTIRLLVNVWGLRSEWWGIAKWSLKPARPVLFRPKDIRR